MVDLLDLIPGVAGQVLREQRRVAALALVTMVRPFGEGAVKAARSLGQARRTAAGAKSTRFSTPVRMRIRSVTLEEARAINQRRESMWSRLEHTRSGQGYRISVRRKR